MNKIIFVGATLMNSDMVWNLEHITPEALNHSEKWWLRHDNPLYIRVVNKTGGISEFSNEHVINENMEYAIRPIVKYQFTGDYPPQPNELIKINNTKFIVLPDNFMFMIDDDIGTSVYDTVPLISFANSTVKAIVDDWFEYIFNKREYPISASDYFSSKIFTVSI